MRNGDRIVLYAALLWVSWQMFRIAEYLGSIAEGLSL